MEITGQTDDQLRVELFKQLVARLEAAVREDPGAQVFNRTSTMFSLSRHGNLLTVGQGAAHRLVRGQLTRKQTPENADRPWAFTLTRAEDRSRLASSLDGQEGSADEVLDAIVKSFLESTEPPAPVVAPPAS